MLWVVSLSNFNSDRVETAMLRAARGVATRRRGDGVPADAVDAKSTASHATLHYKARREPTAPNSKRNEEITDALTKCPAQVDGRHVQRVLQLFVGVFVLAHLFAASLFVHCGDVFPGHFHSDGPRVHALRILLIAPIDVCINVIENTMTMGAASFVDFMVSFMVGLSITMIDRLYLGPAVDTVTTLIPRC